MKANWDASNSQMAKEYETLRANMEKLYQQLNNSHRSYLAHKKKLDEQFNATMLGKEKAFYESISILQKKYDIKSKETQVALTKEGTEERKQAELNLAKAQAKIAEDSAVLTKLIYLKQYKELTAQQKIELKKQEQDTLAQESTALKNRLVALEAISGKNRTKKQQEEIDSYKDQLDEINRLQTEAEKEIARNRRNAIREETKEKIEATKKGTAVEQEAAKKELKQYQANNFNKLQTSINYAKKRKAELKKLGKSDEEIEKDPTLVGLNRDINAYAEASGIGAKGQNLLNNNVASKLMSAAGAMLKVGDKLGNVLNVSENMKAAESILNSYQSRVNANLQGSDKTFQDMLDMTQANVGFSPIVSMEKVLESIKTASDQGIVYNIEQRAFLASISDKIAHTFDAFDSNLTRLIKLQQADSTAARLGMEASLTKLFNSTFNDSSYLSDVYDSVSQAILDANSQLDRNASAEFEYTVQKWLGALSSLGMSGNTLTQIAEGINYLSTGDVTSLSSNTSLQTLLAMSASNAGLDYANILLNGLDASTTNKLLESMVNYLKDIAENSDNQVVKAAYGDILNMSLSDMRAVSNMTSGDIARISGSTMNFNQMVGETSNQLVQTVMRSALSENLSNIYNNAMFGMGMELASNPATWAFDKMLDFMDSSGIKINLPTVMAAGFGLDLETSVNDLMRMGQGLSGAFALLGNIITALGNDGSTGLNLAAWGGTEYNQRGSGLGGLLGTVIGGTSSSVFVNNNSFDDIKNQSLNAATDDAEKSGEITNKNQKKVEMTMDDLFSAVVGESATDFIRARDEVLEWAYFNNPFSAISTYDQQVLSGFQSVFGNQSVLDGGALKTTDQVLKAVRRGTVIGVNDDRFNFENGDLRVIVKSGNLTADIKNGSLTALVSGITAAAKPQEVKVSSSSGPIQIDAKSIKQAILDALSSPDDAGIQLKTFIENSLSNNGTSAPVFKVRNVDADSLTVKSNNTLMSANSVKF